MADDAAYTPNGDAQAPPGEAQHWRAVAHREAALDGVLDLDRKSSAHVHALLAIEARIEELSALLGER